MQLTFKFAVISAFASMALGATGSGPTWDLYQESRFRPILMYECYRTDVTIEPEGTVNFTLLWDSTKASGNEVGTSWAAMDGTPDSYSTSTFNFTYDDQSSSISLKTTDVQEQIVELITPFNNLAYYLKITITSQDNRVVYKIYDEETSCGNAASMLKIVDSKQKKGFTFVRDVAEPDQVCVKAQLCAE